MSLAINIQTDISNLVESIERKGYKVVTSGWEYDQIALIRGIAIPIIKLGVARNTD
jgi:hypothetical protein